MLRQFLGELRIAGDELVFVGNLTALSRFQPAGQDGVETFFTIRVVRVLWGH